MDEITVEQLETQAARAQYCASVTLPGVELAPILDVALAAANTYDRLTIERLQRAAGAAEVTLTGKEIRMVLERALQAKLAAKKRPAHLRMVRSI